MNYIKLGTCCDDCCSAIANDDYTGMDDETQSRVRDGIQKAPGYLVIGEEEGFSWRLCDICGGLAGYRHQVGYLTSKKEA